MSSLSDIKKKRILKLLDKISKDIAILHKKNAKKTQSKRILGDNAQLTNYYRRFKSPRKILGKTIDKAKGKFYYETEYFIGEIVARQEKFNTEIIEYLEHLEKELKTLKKRK
ncbi:hypothetical protein J7J83_02915 [bacterium]|nr:hypothetical protein [bacterium]